MVAPTNNGNQNNHTFCKCKEIKLLGSLDLCGNHRAMTQGMQSTPAAELFIVDIKYCLSIL